MIKDISFVCCKYVFVCCVLLSCFIYILLRHFACVTDNRVCQMRRRILGNKYKQIQIYLFNDLFVWVSARGKFKGSYSFYDPNV